MENYEEKYKAALGWMQSLYDGLHGKTKEEAEHYFPELKNEDERIREAIIATIHLYYGEPLEDEAKEMIAWLEKQGQKKPAWSEEDETVLNNLIYALANDKIGNNRDEYVDWLKSLKPQSQWKPSEEQLDALQYVYRNCNPLPSDKEGWDSIKTLELMYQDLNKLKG